MFRARDATRRKVGTLSIVRLAPRDAIGDSLVKRVSALASHGNPREPPIATLRQWSAKVRTGGYPLAAWSFREGSRMAHRSASRVPMGAEESLNRRRMVPYYAAGMPLWHSELHSSPHMAPRSRKGLRNLPNEGAIVAKATGRSHAP
jgi:hypothetical protein